MTAVDFLTDEKVKQSASDFLGEADEKVPVKPSAAAFLDEEVSQAAPRALKEDLLAQQKRERLKGALSSAVANLAGKAEYAVEGLTPSGLLNQPTRIAGAVIGKNVPDVYQAGVPIANIPEPQGKVTVLDWGDWGLAF
jgi:hypothetical protein